MAFPPQTSDSFAYVFSILWVFQCFKSFRAWEVHVLALTDFYTLSNVFMKGTLKGSQGSPPPPFFLPSTMLLEALIGRVVARYHSALFGRWPSFLQEWKGPQWTRHYHNATCAQLPSSTSLFFNYWTSTWGGSSIIYGFLPPQCAYNYLSKAIIVLISHVRYGHALPCPCGVSMEIERHLSLKDIRGRRSHIGVQCLYICIGQWNLGWLPVSKCSSCCISLKKRKEGDLCWTDKGLKGNCYSCVAMQI